MYNLYFHYTRTKNESQAQKDVQRLYDVEHLKYINIRNNKDDYRMNNGQNNAYPDDRDNPCHHNDYNISPAP